MKFRQYLKEYKSMAWPEDRIDEFNEMVERDSKKYLSMLKGKTPFVRGANYKGNLGKAAVRKDRKASSEFAHGKDAVKFVNEWLEKNGFPRRDQSVIVTSQ